MSKQFPQDLETDDLAHKISASTQQDRISLQQAELNNFAERLTKTEIGSGLRSSSNSETLSLDIALITKIEKASTKKRVRIVDISDDSSKESPQ